MNQPSPTPVAVPKRLWPITLIFGVMFGIFATIEWTTIRSLSVGPFRDVSDLVFWLFRFFWILGWTVGVFFLGAITAFLVYCTVARVEPAKPLDAPMRRVQQAIASRLTVASGPSAVARKQVEDDPALTPASSVALVVANLIPLAGVLFFHWSLGNVMLLYWAESAVIGFYTVLKIAVVGKLVAIAAAPFFIGHFGGFMVVHFLLIYEFVIRGFHAGPEPPLADALRGLFVPIWGSLLMMFVSHGVSFFTNFMGRGEYERTTVTALMNAPYKRIIVMQLALIFGGWIVILFHSPTGVLALLVVMKIALDFAAHRQERKRNG